MCLALFLFLKLYDFQFKVLSHTSLCLSNYYTTFLVHVTSGETLVSVSTEGLVPGHLPLWLNEISVAFTWYPEKFSVCCQGALVSICLCVKIPEWHPSCFWQNHLINRKRGWFLWYTCSASVIPWTKVNKLSKLRPQFLCALCTQIPESYKKKSKHFIVWTPNPLLASSQAFRKFWTSNVELHTFPKTQPHNQLLPRLVWIWQSQCTGLPHPQVQGIHSTLQTSQFHEGKLSIPGGDHLLGKGLYWYSSWATRDWCFGDSQGEEWTFSQLFR